MMTGDLTVRGIGDWFLEEVGSAIDNPDVDLVPHVAGLGAVAMSYGLAVTLAATDGPLPFGDALALGILAVPDVVWYGIGYSFFD